MSSNHFRTSSGDRVSKTTIDRKVREAKAKKIQDQINDLGYNICEEMGTSGCEPDESCARLDCSHIESVDSCQKNGRSEKAWDVKNITILGRKCHQKRDKLNLIWKS